MTAIAERTATRAMPRWLKWRLVRIRLQHLLEVDPDLRREGDLLLQVVLDDDRDPHPVGDLGRAAVGVLGRPAVLPLAVDGLEVLHLEALHAGEEDVVRGLGLVPLLVAGG